MMNSLRTKNEINIRSASDAAIQKSIEKLDCFAKSARNDGVFAGYFNGTALDLLRTYLDKDNENVAHYFNAHSARYKSVLAVIV